MFEVVVIAAYLEAAVRLGVPLALAALGETVTERSGVINIGLEGSMIAGALAGALGALAWGSAGWGAAAGTLAGCAMAGVFALFAVGLGANQIIAGTAVTAGGLGFTAVIYQARFGATGAQLSLPTLDPLRLPLLSELPLVGPALFAQSITSYVAYVAAPVIWWLLFRTGWGLSLRAVGEAPSAAAAAGVPVRTLRFLATLAGGALGGLAGAHLALAHTGSFAEGM